MNREVGIFSFFHFEWACRAHSISKTIFASSSSKLSYRKSSEKGGWSYLLKSDQLLQAELISLVHKTDLHVTLTKEYAGALTQIFTYSSIVR